MINKCLAHKLIEFASFEYQDCYIIHGNKGVYRCIEDIVNEYNFHYEQALDDLKLGKKEEDTVRSFNSILESEAGDSSRPLWRAYHRDRKESYNFFEMILWKLKIKKMTSKDIERVLFESTSKHDGWSESERVAWVTDFIENNPSWNKLRQKAIECLQQLGEDLRIWENTLVDWNRVGLERPEKYRAGHSKKFTEQEMAKSAQNNKYLTSDGNSVDHLSGEGHIPACEGS